MVIALLGRYFGLKLLGQGDVEVAIAAKPGDLNLMVEIHMVEGEN